MKKITFLLLISISFVLSNSLNAQNLLLGWEGNGITGTGSKPNEVGWLNTISASIPWNTANSTSGCRFRDSGVTGGYTAGSYIIEGGGTLTTRMLMLRYDNGTYSSSVYAYKVSLDACATYTFSWDYVCGGSGTPPQNITVGISTTPNSTGRLSSKTFATSSSTTIFRSGTYTFTTGATAGDYYLTFNGAAVWYGIANLSLVKSSDQSLSLSKQYAFFDNSVDGLTESFFVQGSALTENVTLSAPAGITLIPSTVSATDAQCGVTVTATYDNSANITNGVIMATSSGFTKSITVDAVKDNTIGSWDADGSIDATASVPTVLGWGSTGTVTWVAANLATVGSLRYFDAPANYKYKDLTYSGRILYLRWDGNNSAGINGIFSYPVTLDACKSYTFSTKAAWNSNGTAPVLTFAVNALADNTGTNYGTGTLTTGAATTLLDGSFTFSVPTAGTYYITISSNTASLIGIADLSVTQNTQTSLTLSKTNLLFTDNDHVKTFVVNGNLLADNVILTAPSGIILNKDMITPSEAQCGFTVTATFDKTTSIKNGEILAQSGSLTQSITVNSSIDNACFSPLYSDRQNLITDPYCNELTNFGGWGNRSIVTDYVYCGARSMKITGTCGGSLDFNLTGKIQGDKTYLVRALVSTNGTGEAKIGVSGATAESVILPVSTSAGEWLPFTFKFTTQSTITSANMFFNSCETQTATEGYIDNWEMYDVTDIVSGLKTSRSKEYKVYTQSNSIVSEFNSPVYCTAEISIYNLQGMRIQNFVETCNAGDNKLVIESTIPSGVYFVKLNINGDISTSKLVK